MICASYAANQIARNWDRRRAELLCISQHSTQTWTLNITQHVTAVSYRLYVLVYNKQAHFLHVMSPIPSLLVDSDIHRKWKSPFCFRMFMDGESRQTSTPSWKNYAYLLRIFYHGQHREIQAEYKWKCLLIPSIIIIYHPVGNITTTNTEK